MGGGANNSYTLYLYLGGKAIAEHNSASGVTYLHTDALGSPVAKTNAAGALVIARTLAAFVARPAVQRGLLIPAAPPAA